MSTHLKMIHTQASDFWLARASVLVVVVLQVGINNQFALGGRFLAPFLELSLLIPLSVATAWAQGKAKIATEVEHWYQVLRIRQAVRFVAIALTALITIMNCGALLNLIATLVDGGGKTNGHMLLVDALNLWVTNVVAFALWYWTLDRGGPAARGVTKTQTNDFLFPQMTLSDSKSSASWSPGFIDYLFLAFTNATAFSPTDTLPLTARAKILMMAQSGISFLTVALVAARAVNVLA